MTSRTDMDRPATVFTAVLGVALIATSLPFLLFDEGGSQRYDIAWTQVVDEAADAPFAGNGQPAEVELPAAGMLANVTVVMESCNDSPNQVDPAATITWELFRDNVSLDSGSAPCQAGDVATVALGGHPDVGSIRAGSASEAQEQAYEADRDHENTTSVFRLEFSWSRTSTVPIGLPVGASTFAGRMGLEVKEWRATATEPQEDLR